MLIANTKHSFQYRSKIRIVMTVVSRFVYWVFKAEQVQYLFSFNTKIHADNKYKLNT